MNEFTLEQSYELIDNLGLTEESNGNSGVREALLGLESSTNIELGFESIFNDKSTAGSFAKDALRKITKVFSSNKDGLALSYYKDLKDIDVNKVKEKEVTVKLSENRVEKFLEFSDSITFDESDKNYTTKLKSLFNDIVKLLEPYDKLVSMQKLFIIQTLTITLVIFYIITIYYLIKRSARAKHIPGDVSSKLEAKVNEMNKLTIEILAKKLKVKGKADAVSVAEAVDDNYEKYMNLYSLSNNKIETTTLDKAEKVKVVNLILKNKYNFLEKLKENSAYKSTQSFNEITKLYKVLGKYSAESFNNDMYDRDMSIMYKALIRSVELYIADTGILVNQLKKF